MTTLSHAISRPPQTHEDGRQQQIQSEDLDPRPEHRSPPHGEMRQRHPPSTRDLFSEREIVAERVKYFRRDIA
jgi:hypothetical protein